MKKITLQSLMFTCFCFLPFLLAAQAESSCAQLDGVWEYDFPDRRGLAFNKGDRFMVIHVPKERKTFSSEDPTPQEKATAVDGLVAVTGTMTCEDNRLTLKVLYSKDPTQAGQSLPYDIEIKDGKFKFRPVREDGSHGPEGNCHRIADFGDSNKEICGTAEGFWEYELPNQYGIAAIAGGYHAWILVDKTFWDDKAELSTVDKKALAYDKVIGAAGSYSCDDQGRPVWKSLHAKNYRSEGTSFITENELKGDVIQHWFLDADGKRTGIGGKAVRLK